MAIADQSELWEQLRRRYTATEPTGPSAIRPQYLKYNSISKARDLGVQDNLLLGVIGTVGTRSGANTLYFKVTLQGPARLGISAVNLSSQDSRWLSLGLLDGDHKPINLNEIGFGVPPLLPYDYDGPVVTALPAGTYYFTISSSQWADIDFQVLLAIVSYAALDGVATFELQTQARLAMAQMDGVASLEDRSTGSFPPMATLDLIEGPATMNLVGEGPYVSTRRGTAVLELRASARFTTFFYIGGVAGMNLQASADLSVSSPYGGGY